MTFGRSGGALVFAFIVFALVGGISGAQNVPEVHGSPPPSGDADVTLDADVHIRSIHYSTAPKTRVTVTGVNEIGGYTVTRTNLPRHPRAGATYRNVRIQFHAASRFVDPAQARRTAPPAAAR
jgi:hypothetical protein